jgi:hypothetical protein
MALPDLSWQEPSYLWKHWFMQGQEYGLGAISITGSEGDSEVDPRGTRWRTVDWAQESEFLASSLDDSGVQ